MKINKYQAIPSIPGQAQAFGYSENETKELEINKNPVSVHTGQRSNSVGPGQYEHKTMTQLNKRGAIWGKSQVPRMQQKVTKSGMLVGPGTYDVNANLNPLYKYKPSSGFCSKSLRQFEFQKGSIANKHILEQFKQQARNLGNELDIENADQEFIEDAVPGPGYYHNDQIASSIKVQNCPQKLQFFGSSSLRFKTMQVPQSSVGPGDYELRQQQFLENKVISKVKPPFQSTQKMRFADQQNENPGPGSYDPKVNFEDLLVKKIQVGYKGQFGVADKRFKIDEEKEELPGPGTYFEQDKFSLQNQPVYFQKSNDKNYYFIPPTNPKNIDRATFIEKKNVPSVGTYELDQYNIGKKLENNQDIDPDLIVKVDGLGFNSSQPRFKEKKSIVEEEDDDEDKSDIMHQRSLNQMLKKQNNPPGVGFGARDNRFKYKDQTQPGPGQYYDTHQNMWNKRTYNIEFTGIK